MAPAITTVSNKRIPIQEDTNEKNDFEIICPVDYTKGLKVTVVTLRNHVLEKYWYIIRNNSFYFCQAKECPMVYFNNNKRYYFTTEDIKSRVSYKKGPEPRPICYCLNVLEHKIVDEILVNKCCTSLEDIKRYTGARTGKLCYVTNPSGRCCGSQVNELIVRGLQLLKEDSLLVRDLLRTVHSGCEYCQHESEYINPSISQIVDSCKECHIPWEENTVNE